jgi:ribose 5-phosphate isomerase B
VRIAIGSDERSELTQDVVADLQRRGHDVIPFGPLADQPETWATVARAVAEAVAGGQAAEGILFCWTGTGVSLAANKVPGIRAALCADAETARGARLWNNANILCLSLRLTSLPVAKEILDSWFETTYQPNPDDDACLAAVNALDLAYRSPPPPEPTD